MHDGGSSFPVCGGTARPPDRSGRRTGRLLPALALALTAIGGATATPAMAGPKECDLVARVLRVDLGLGVGWVSAADLPAEADRIAAMLARIGRPRHLSPGEHAHISATMVRWRWPAVLETPTAVPVKAEAFRIDHSLRVALRMRLNACWSHSDVSLHSADARMSGQDARTPETGQGAQQTDAADTVAPAAAPEEPAPVMHASNSGVLWLLLLSVIAIGVLIPVALRADRRNDRRHICKIDTMAIVDDAPLRCSVVEISRTGCKLHGGDSMGSAGSRCLVALGAFGIEGRIVWANRHYAGIAFMRYLSRKDVAALTEGRPLPRSGHVASPFGPGRAAVAGRDAGRLRDEPA